MTEEPRTSESRPGPVASDAYYRNLFEHAGVAMISSDTDLIIRAWNGAAAMMFGASGESMIGASAISVIPGEGRVEGERLMRRTIERGTVEAYEFKHRDARGEGRDLAVTISPVVDDDGNRLGVLGCFRDITRRTTLAVELAQRNKMASLGRMAGALAHHYNNVLGGVVTSIDFALSTDNPSFQDRALRQTSHALARATKISESLQAIAEGDQKHEDECDLTELILSVAEYMESELGGLGVELELQLKASCVTRVPRAQLITVIENILHNAADAMPDGGRVTIATRIEDGVVTLTITDTGCGMDPARIRDAFDPFYSTKTSEVMDFEHHPGLGLTIAHGILQVLGHSITIESEPGKSTTVSIRFDPESVKVD